MRILVVGSGGREHALGWALARTGNPTLFFAPGNPGTGILGRNVPIGPNALGGLVSFARRESVGLTVVGPEVPLVNGIVDAFEAAGLKVVGPSAVAAVLEGSKAFAKAFMARYGIPTAAFETFSGDHYDAAWDYVKAQGAPIVIKASGLAAGKGAIVCKTLHDAQVALHQIMRSKDFGEAGEEVVIEEYMTGEEASFFAFTDGDDYVCLSPAQDHKQVGEGDTGPNTGGMGAYAPVPLVDEALLHQVCEKIIEPTLERMASEDRVYRGCLYAGTMITDSGPKVVEFNCRLGDPEAQAVLPLLNVDATEMMLSIAERRLGRLRVPPSSDAAACVILASRGYPGKHEKGFEISGLQAASEQALIFHAGTREDERGRVVTAGGRVLGVTGLGPTLPQALEHAYAAADSIHFEGVTMRRDIGQKGIARLKS